MARLLSLDGTVAGAGFLVAEDVLVTCAHVVRLAGAGPGGRVRVAFPAVTGAHELGGEVLSDPWRAPEEEDVAFVRLPGSPMGPRVLPLGSAAGSAGHRVRSFGFPAQAPPAGHFGYGRAGDLLPASADRGALLQLTDANDLTTGFSGAPVLDLETGLVIGLLTEITAPDAFARGQGIAYVTPTETLREIRHELTAQEVCPYRGLEPFTAEHARWFQGRGEAVRQVLANLSGGRRLTLLLGPSGSGKSSLIQAGVLRALAEGAVPGSDRWLPVLVRPRQDLAAEIERAGLPGAARDGIATAVRRRLGNEPGYERVLLVIDQFEEFFTEAAGGRLRQRTAAADELTALGGSPTPLSVVLVMRDDFYPQLAARTPRLLDAALPGLLNVPGSLSQDDLQAIITLPAEDVGLRFQPGLPEQIVADVLATSPDTAAARQAPVTVLPLLELTLQQLWGRRQDGFLTHDGYRRIGAVSGSLTTWCDRALDELSPDRQQIARRALTALVRPADPSRRIPPVRQQVPLDALRLLAAGPDNAPDGDVEAVFAALSRHRIITTQTLRDPRHPDAPPGEPVAELIHDALIRDWVALREWVRQDRRFHEWLDRTQERQQRWAEKRDPGDLLAGTALAEGIDWSRKWGLPDDITAYLTASRQHQEAAAQRRRRVIAVLATLLVLALFGGAGAVWQWRTADAERQAALSRQLATQSDTLIDVNPELSSLLAVQAYRTSHTAESLASLRSAASFLFSRRLTGHTDVVHSVAFSPDGHTVASAGGEGTVRLWDSSNGSTRSTLNAHAGEVSSVAYSRNGRVIATGHADGTRLWDTTTHKVRMKLPETDDVVFSVAFSPDGHTIATAGANGSARLWDASTGKPRTRLRGHTDTVWSVGFSPDGRTVATVGADGKGRLWDATTGKLRTILPGHTAQVLSVAFSPDSRTIATGAGDSTVRLWDATTGKLRSRVDLLSNTVFSLAFSPDGHTLALAGGSRVSQLLNLDTRAVSSSLIGHADDVNAVTFSPDGRTLATGSNDKTVRLWDITGGGSDVSLIGHTGLVHSVEFSPDGHTVATASADKTVRLWDTDTGTTRTTLHGHDDEVFEAAFSPDGHTIATASQDSTAGLWDATTGKARTLLRESKPVQSVAFSPDGRTLATGSRDGTVRLRDATTGETRATLPGHDDAVFSMAFSPDSRTLATGSLDKTVRLWDVATHHARVIGTSDTVNDVVFSPDGRTLATAIGDYTVRLWDVATRKTRTILVGRTGQAESVAFSPDGRTLATAEADWTTGLWDVSTGKSLMTLMKRHTDEVTSVAYGRDGHTLASASGDKTVRLWRVALPKPSEAIRKICRAVNRELDPQERAAYLPDRSAESVCPAHP